MKLFLILFFTVASLNCSQNQAILKVEYKAETRGASKYIAVTENNYLLELPSKKSSFPTLPKDWQSISKLVNEINLSELENIEIPTSKSHSDAAMQAQLIITTKEKVIQSPYFDDGNPPKELKSIVEKLFLLAK